MNDSLAKVDQVYSSAKCTAEENFKNGTNKLNRLFDEGLPLFFAPQIP